MIVISSLNLLKKSISRSAPKGMTKLFNVKLPKVNSRRNFMRIDHNGSKARLPTTFSANAANLFNKLPLKLKAPGLLSNQFKKMVKYYSMSNFKLTKH